MKEREAESMEAKIAIIQRMASNGYHLMGRTAEELASIFTAEELANMERKFNEWRAEK